MRTPLLLAAALLSAPARREAAPALASAAPLVVVDGWGRFHGLIVPRGTPPGRLAVWDHGAMRYTVRPLGTMQGHGDGRSLAERAAREFGGTP